VHSQSVVVRQKGSRKFLLYVIWMWNNNLVVIADAET
jgi:hypothetical protein